MTERKIPLDPLAAYHMGIVEGGKAICFAVNELLNGNDDGSCLSPEPWESTRRRLLRLMAAHPPAPAVELLWQCGYCEGHRTEIEAAECKGRCGGTT